MHVLADSSMAAERVPTVKLTELSEYMEAMERALGNDTSCPMLITTDNSSNQRVASGEGSASRSRHDLQRYIRVQQRVARGRAIVRHVDDEENPADFLTKWVKAAKLALSLEYVTNSANAVERTPPQFIAEATAAFKAALMRAAGESEA